LGFWCGLANTLFPDGASFCDGSACARRTRQRDCNRAFYINLTWSPVFFGQHKVSTAFYIILTMLVVAIATTIAFGRVRKAAAWLMVPYLVWISFAAILNYQIDQLNPDAESLYVPAASSQIGSGR
jgi:translocator protein